MDRRIPVSNKIVFKRIVDKNRQIHLSKLENIKSTISRAAPHSFSQTRSNKKRVQVNEDKLVEIERENKVLLDKLTNIMRSTSQNGAPESSSIYSKSLNRELRKRELVKITIENQALMKRLQEQKPAYKRQIWDHDRRQQEQYLKNISEYPINLTLPNNSTLGPTEDRPRTYQAHREKTTAFPSFISNASDRMSASARSPEMAKKVIPVKKFTGEKLDPVNARVAQKTMVYQTKRKIGFSNYSVNIYIHHDTFNIMASNNERADLKALSMSMKEGEELVARYKGRYEAIIDQIRFKGSNIVLGNNSICVETGKMDDTTEIIEAENEGEEEKTAPQSLTPSRMQKKQSEIEQENEKKSSKGRLSNNSPEEAKSVTSKGKMNDSKQSEEIVEKESQPSEKEIIDMYNSNENTDEKYEESSSKGKVEDQDSKEKEKKSASEIENEVEEAEAEDVSEEVQEDYGEDFEKSR